VSSICLLCAPTVDGDGARGTRFWRARRAVSYGHMPWAHWYLESGRGVRVMAMTVIPHNVADPN
jgi:hypothetical protein